MTISSCWRRRDLILPLFWRTPRLDSFPQLRTMDENTWIALETQPHSPAANLEHGHRDHGLAVVQTSNGNRFLLFSGQDQHRKTPFMADGLAQSRFTYPRTC